MNEIKIFNNSQFGDIRTATTETGEPLFCLADLCAALNLESTNKVVARLDLDDRSSIPLIDRLGRNQNATFVTESGMYTVILRSDSPLAKPMQKWVTSEVLPSIRKTGGYIHTTENDTPELIMARALIVAQGAIENFNEKIKSLEAMAQQRDHRLELQQAVIRQAAPKVEYYEEVLQSTTAHLTNTIAKELGMSATTLNKKLNDKGVQYKQAGCWVLKAKYQNKGLSKSRTYTYTDNHGKTQTAIQTVWTEVGREFIHKTMAN